MRTILSILTIVIVNLGFASGNPEGAEIYMDNKMNVIENKDKATYLCEITEQTEQGYHVKAYFMSGEIKMEGWFTDAELNNPHGTFTYYYQNGQVESTGEFMAGSKFGLWERFDFEGNPKPEKIYATLQIMEAIANK